MKLITIAVLVGSLLVAHALSILTDSAVIESEGIIANVYSVTAKSGYWQDIQNAADQVAAAGGGNLYIPAGSFNFVNAGESWTDARVIIPAGVNVYGASNNRDANGQNTEWRTILRLPWDVPGSWLGGSGDPPKNGGPRTPVWFRIRGNSDPNKPSRFSDVKLVGYRSVDSSSVMIVRGLQIDDVANFRVDHCHFENIAGGAIGCYGYNTQKISGVIDHCNLTNTNGWVGYPWDENTCGYGVDISRDYGDYWEDDITNVYGHYTEYSVYIEDCNFSKWRHCISANSGAHYVFRHNIITEDFGYTGLDAHGWFQTACNNPSHGAKTNPEATWTGTDWGCSYCGAPLRSTNSESYFYITQVGTRAVEIYDNIIMSATDYIWAITIRGGGLLLSNNTIGGGTYTTGLYLWLDAINRPEGSKVWIHDTYVWNNKFLPPIDDNHRISVYDTTNDIIENVDYFLRAPSLELDGWEYTQYPYPHPLTQGYIMP